MCALWRPAATLQQKASLWRRSACLATFRTRVCSCKHVQFASLTNKSDSCIGILREHLLTKAAGSETLLLILRSFSKSQISDCTCQNYFWSGKEPTACRRCWHGADDQFFVVGLWLHWNSKLPTVCQSSVGGCISLDHMTLNCIFG